MNKQLISVIIPVYQAAERLDLCLQSVIDQTYRNLQIIVVDDCSTDGSYEICDNFSRKDSRIEVIHLSENTGSVVARKKGLEVARGKYIGFVDSDDYLLPNHYLELENALEESKADFVHSWIIYEYPDGRKSIVGGYSDERIIKNYIDRKEAIKKYFLDKESRLNNIVCSKLYKKEFCIENFNKIPESQMFGEDCIFLFHCLNNCNHIKVIESNNYMYFIREKSLSHMNDGELILKKLELIDTIRKINKDMESPLQQDELYFWIREELSDALQESDDNLRKIGKLQYYLKGLDKYIDKKIVIYGAGNVGKDYLNQMTELGFNKPVAIVDKDVRGLYWDSIKVIEPLALLNLEYDEIIIANNNENTAREIREELISIGVPDNKIYWEVPVR